MEDGLERQEGEQGGKVYDMEMVADDELEREDCGFDVENDQRQYAAKNFYRMDVLRNISASISTDLGCLACGNPHSVGGKSRGGGGVARVFLH